MEIVKIIKGFGSYRAVVKSKVGILHISEIEECSGGYEAFLYFKEMGVQLIEFKGENSKEWCTVFLVEEGRISICDESIFRELTVDDSRGIFKSSEKFGKAFKVYDVIEILEDQIVLK